MKNMKNGESGKNSSNTINPIGEWKVGDDEYFISFALTKKPNPLRRFFAWAFFGLVWIDFEAPKEVADIKPAGGVKVAKKIEIKR